ncbi:UNVERIFIED_CONTAM: hypothetical protein FKN15_025267 [Acipenser sinensis]
MISVVGSMADDVYGNSDFHQQIGKRKHRDRERYQAPDHNVCGTRSIVFLYVLLIASSVMWAALLSLLFVKCSAEIQKLQTLLQEKDQTWVSVVKTKQNESYKLIEMNTIAKLKYTLMLNRYKKITLIPVTVTRCTLEQNYIGSQVSTEHHLGLSDQESESNWKWLDGTSVADSLWNSGEPNSAGEEDCAEITVGKLNDIPCSVKQRWICEKTL